MRYWLFFMVFPVSLVSYGQCDDLTISRARRDAFTGKSSPLTVQTPEAGGVYATRTIDPGDGSDTMRLTIRIKGGGPYMQAQGVVLLLADSSRIQKSEVWVVAIPATGLATGWHWQATFGVSHAEAGNLLRTGLLAFRAGFVDYRLTRRESVRLGQNLNCLLTWR